MKEITFLIFFFCIFIIFYILIFLNKLLFRILKYLIFIRITYAKKKKLLKDNSNSILN